MCVISFLNDPLTLMNSSLILSLPELLTRHDCYENYYRQGMIATKTITDKAWLLRKILPTRHDCYENYYRQGMIATKTITDKAWLLRKLLPTRHDCYEKYYRQGMTATKTITDKAWLLRKLLPTRHDCYENYYRQTNELPTAPQKVRGLQPPSTSPDRYVPGCKNESKRDQNRMASRLIVFREILIYNK